MEEQTVFEIKPSYRGFAGWIIFGILSLFVLVGVILLPIILFIVWLKVSHTVYRLTNERLLISTGWIARNTQELELYRVQDVTIQQGFFQRIFGVGTVSIVSVDRSTPKVLINGIARPDTIKEQIRTAYRAARKLEGVRTSENII